MDISKFRELLEIDMYEGSKYLSQHFIKINDEILEQKPELQVEKSLSEDSKIICSKLELNLREISKNLEDLDTFITNYINTSIKELTDSFIGIIENNEFTKITKISVNVANEPEKFKLGWMIFCFAE
jgi:hypothetical protein